MKWRLLRWVFIPALRSGCLGERDPDPPLPDPFSTGYEDLTPEEAWNSVIVAPHNVPPADSTVFSFSQNEVFLPDNVCPGVIGHANDEPSSSLQLLLYGQPAGN